MAISGEPDDPYENDDRASRRLARQHAKERHLTLKALIEQGLRTVMTQEEEEKPFKLRDMSVDGNGMTSEFQNMTWEQRLEAIYEGRR